jgi:glutaminyl-tRNA synthetase
VKSTLHWVSAAHAIDAEVRLYDRLFSVEDPDATASAAGKDFTANLNPHSFESIRGAKLEPSLAAATPGTRFQFERLGYFVVDPDSAPGAPVFNRTVPLKDAWARAKAGAASGARQ